MLRAAAARVVCAIWFGTTERTATASGGESGDDDDDDDGDDDLSALYLQVHVMYELREYRIVAFVGSWIVSGDGRRFLRA